ncbi:unnamed protein product [Clonostachys solani]|uniref:Enoyl reductase (ER) domain-containing protein n=1 Tax=Clonostachys solani TaxID=160281 RepID=A0A9P0EE97_9HYPO|nr:unnamed protein product [Clonostachys solani]
MPTFKVYKGSEDGYPKESTTTKPDELVGDNVLVKITASGICGTDLHHRQRDVVLGHEGVGIVEDVGPQVKYLKKGTRVAWGFVTGSCGHCLLCLQGEEVFCRERCIYGFHNVDQGSFGSHAVWSEAFLHVVPDSISDEDAAPLQCGGATSFTALEGVKPTDTVAIMGVGGLGHLSIQFANKLGCRVVVLSGTSSKREEALKLGAHKFISMADYKPEDFDDEWKINRLLIATSVLPKWEILLPMLAPKAIIYALSVSFANLEMPYMPFILDGISVKGSLVATRAVHREMLDFAAFHGIKPVVETFPLTAEGMKEAMDKLDSGKIHFKAVLVAK